MVSGIIDINKIADVFDEDYYIERAEELRIQLTQVTEIDEQTIETIMDIVIIIEYLSFIYKHIIKMDYDEPEWLIEYYFELKEKVKHLKQYDIYTDQLYDKEVKDIIDDIYELIV